MHEYQERHSAQGSNFADLFPTDLIQKGVDVSGNFTTLYRNEKFIEVLRTQAERFMTFDFTGVEIASTGRNNQFKIYLPKVMYNSFNTPVTVDDLVEQGIDIVAFYSSTSGYQAQVLLINNITTY